MSIVAIDLGSARRRSRDVVQCLLDEMDRLVRDYHPDCGRTGRNVDELIDGTAVFPGGSGLWRGPAFHGPLPELFPEGSIMFVAHNFDSIDAYKRAKIRGGETQSIFWQRLLDYLKSANIHPDRCFFTNALAGLKPGSATGPMPTVDGYREQCQQFLVRQVDIVKPFRIVALGGRAEGEVRRAKGGVPFIRILHPSAWELRPRDTRSQRTSSEGQRIAHFLAGS